MKILSRLKNAGRYPVKADDEYLDEFKDAVYFSLFFNSEKYPKLAKFISDYFGGLDHILLPEDIKGCDCCLTALDTPWIVHTFVRGEKPFDLFNKDRVTEFRLDDDKKSDFTNCLSSKDLKVIEDALNKATKKVEFKKGDEHVEMFGRCPRIYLN